MADPKGFLAAPRETPARRPVDLRLHDWREVYEPFPATLLERQAGPCVDCRIPFFHNGCPLGNLIPEWNDLVWRHDWRDAADRLHATNNFPEFTGRLCPAPCEAACVLGINANPVTIKQVEVEIIDRAFASGWVTPRPPAVRSGRTVAVIGSGPAGLAAAQQLTRAGHAVTVFERDDAPGGLLRYGIPAFKLEKRHLDRRLDQMQAEGTEFRCGVEAGTAITADELRAGFDAVVLCGGARVPRDLPRPPQTRPGHQPWPTYPMIYRVSSAHEEGGERTYAVSSLEFLGDGSVSGGKGGRVRALRLADAKGFDPVPGTERDLPCDLVLLAMGFTGAERPGLLTDLGVEFDQRGNVGRDSSYATSVPGLFHAGDMGRRQSLIVWAIAEGRSAAAAVARYLSGDPQSPDYREDAALPAPIAPTARPLT